MTKRYCDKCGCELPRNEGFGFKIAKSYKVSFLHRDIISYEKESYDNKEYCQKCYFSFYKLYREFKKNKEKLEK